MSFRQFRAGVNSGKAINWNEDGPSDCPEQVRIGIPFGSMAEGDRGARSYGAWTHRFVDHMVRIRTSVTCGVPPRKTWQIPLWALVDPREISSEARMQVVNHPDLEHVAWIDLGAGTLARCVPAFPGASFSLVCGGR
jgi:hypothetical protein